MLEYLCFNGDVVTPIPTVPRTRGVDRKCPPCSKLGRNILALSPRRGRMGIINPARNVQFEYESSRKVTIS